MVFPRRLTSTTTAPSQKSELFSKPCSIHLCCHSDVEGNAKGTEGRGWLCEISHADKNSESLCPSLCSSSQCSVVLQTVGGCFSL